MGNFPSDSFKHSDACIPYPYSLPACAQTPPKKKPPMRAFVFFRKSFIFVALVLMGIITLELVLRVAYGKQNAASSWPSQEEFALNADLIYSGIRNSDYHVKSDEYDEHDKTNSWGFRDGEIKKKNPNTFRVLVVGDSFTFGHGISSNNKTYPKQLELYLRRKSAGSDTNIEVFNLGVKGYTPDQEYRLITTKLVRFEPDLVVWTLSNPGDVFNLLHDPGWPIPSLYDVKDGQLIALDGRMNWLYVGKFIKLHLPQQLRSSYVFNLSIHALSQIQFFSRKPYLPMEDFLDWALTKLKLELYDTKKILSKRSIRLMVVVLPYPELFQARAFPMSISKKLFAVLDKAKTNGIEVLDVQNELSNGQKKSWRKLYLVSDYHPNELGASVFASLVGDRILEYLQLH